MSRLNKRDSQAGGIMAATIVILAGLASVTALTVLSVKRSLNATSQQRAHAQAINAADRAWWLRVNFSVIDLLCILHFGSRRSCKIQRNGI